MSNDGLVQYATDRLDNFAMAEFLIAAGADPDYPDMKQRSVDKFSLLKPCKKVSKAMQISCGPYLEQHLWQR